MSKNSPTPNGARQRTSARAVGGEIRALLWLGRHPLFLLVPAVIGWAGYSYGPVAVGWTLAGLLLAVVLWWRAHPATYDRYAAPRVRSVWRRWTAYHGRRWRSVLTDCELTRHRGSTGQQTCPRVVRVRSVTPSIDTLRVRMARGQHAGTFTEHLPALADALGAHRVAVSRARPGVLSLVVERRMPFTEPVPAALIPTSTADVDLCAIDVGDTEYGTPFLLRVRDKHLLVAGASGSGKGSLLWNPLRAMGPLVRDGLVRPWVIDLKGGTETDRGAALFHRWAITMPDAIALLTDFRDSMLARQQAMRAAGVRHNELSVASPVELLQIDELAMLTAYGDRALVREALRLLAEILTQGRASDHLVMAYVQEPSKDVVDVRDLFTTKVCLGVTAASHVDMVLGDGARERGALADEIPGDPDHAGIGFVVDTGSRLPIRIRAGHVTDPDIDELGRLCTPRPVPAEQEGDVLPFPDTAESDDNGQEAAS